MKYNFTVYQQKVDDHVFWIAKSTDLKGCVGQGDTCAEAIQELELNEIEWLKTAEEYNIPIPPICVKPESSYSGKYPLRMTPFMHEQLDYLAKEQHVSLNHLINEAISFYLGAKAQTRQKTNILSFTTANRPKSKNWGSASSRNTHPTGQYNRAYN